MTGPAGSGYACPQSRKAPWGTIRKRAEGGALRPGPLPILARHRPPSSQRPPCRRASRRRWRSSWRSRPPIPDCLLFYRMGDFYELFFEDAVAAAQALSIVLTKRGKHLGDDIPMCGVPVHRADEYLQRLIAGGFRVAVCEQLEDPAEAKKRGYKAVVRRDVVRLVTPGTLTEDSLLDAKARNYLTALFRGPRGGNEGGDRAGLPRHFHRRVRGRRDRGGRFSRRDRAPFPRRGDRGGCRPGRGGGQEMAGDRRRRRHACARRPLRQPGRRAPAQGPAQSGGPGSLRPILAGRAGRRRRASEVRRADPDRPQTMYQAAPPYGAVRPPADRCSRPARAWSCCARPPATGRRACSQQSTARSRARARASLQHASRAPARDCGHRRATGRGCSS